MVSYTHEFGETHQMDLSITLEDIQNVVFSRGNLQHISDSKITQD